VTAWGRRIIWPGAATAVSLGIYLFHRPILETLAPGVGGEGVRMLAGGAGCFALAWLGARLAALALERAGSRRTPRLLQELVAAALFLAATVAAAVLVLGLPLGSALAGSGLFIAVIGFAVRNVLADVLSGIALGLEAPYRIGDWVEIDSTIRGRVIEIGWRTTRLRTRDDTYMILPNSQIARQRLTNYSAPRSHYRTQVQIALDHAIPVTEARALLTAAAREASGILDVPAADARAISYDADAIRYAVRYWVPSFAEDVDCRDAVYAAIDTALRRRGMPYPYRRIHLVEQAGAEERAMAEAMLR